MERGAAIRAHDPQAMSAAAQLLPGVTLCRTPYEACENADVLVLMTEWNEYRGLDLEKVRDTMKGDVFVDLRNVYERDTMEKIGFSYHCVGR